MNVEQRPKGDGRLPLEVTSPGGSPVRRGNNLGHGGKHCDRARSRCEGDRRKAKSRRSGPVYCWQTSAMMVDCGPQEIFVKKEGSERSAASAKRRNTPDAEPGDLSQRCDTVTKVVSSPFTTRSTCFSSDDVCRTPVLDTYRLRTESLPQVSPLSRSSATSQGKDLV